MSLPNNTDEFLLMNAGTSQNSPAIDDVVEGVEDGNGAVQEKIGPFILKKTLGEGSTGKVKLGVHKDTGQKVAIKIINKKILTHKPHLKKKVEREIAVLKLMRHTHVIRLYDVLQTKKYLFLIMEYVEGGELFDYIVERGRLTIEEAFHFFKQIILGLEYCHQQLICHRDLKPENLLLDRHKNIKIADFGMASFMEEGNLLQTSCGSPHYASPEIVRGLPYNGMDADVWSMGVILYALVTGRLPFDDENLTVLLAKVKEGKYEIPEFLDDDVSDLIQRMIQVVPRQRITLRGIKKHPWWKKMEAKELMLQSMQQQLGKQSSTENLQQLQENQQQQYQQQPVEQQEEHRDTNNVEVNSVHQQQQVSTDAIVSPVDDNNLSPNSMNTPTMLGDSSSKKDEDMKIQYTEEEIDQEVFHSTLEKTGLGEQALKEALMSNEKNLETVLYNLILQYKRELGTTRTDVFTSKYSVSPCNPLTVPVDKASELRKRLQEAYEENDEEDTKKENIQHEKEQQSGIKWFAFWMKKKKGQKEETKKKATPSQFGLHSRKSQSEILTEMSRIFKALQVQFEKVSDSVVRFTCSFPVVSKGSEEKVVMDMTMSALENDGFIINFTLFSGRTTTARILFDAIQDEAEL
ncbi:hypothetical protein ABK040_005511 [Willaertia magna]